MTQPAVPVPPVEPEGQQQPAQLPANPAATPPWERDGTAFDQARAWSRIQNMQAELDRAKARNTELTQYEQQVKAAEEAAKTELQRAQDAAAAAQKEAQDARLALLRHQAANREGKVLPAGLADRLRGNTKEELETDADAMLAMLPQQPAAPAGAATTPVSALRPGALPQPPAPNLDELIADALKRGDIAESIRLKNQKLIHAKAAQQR